jgi:hypothetical protein
MVTWFAAGAAAWAISVGVKVVISGILHIAAGSCVSDDVGAALDGLVSAARGAEGEAAAGEGGPGDREGLTGLRRHTFLVERTAALIGHVGSRGLVWLSVHGPLWPGAAALLAFASVDGLAAYGVRREWDWLSPRVWWRFYPVVFGMGVLELLAFGVIHSRLP